MYNARMDFNNRFLALREVKKKVISEINARVVQLKEINQQLGKQDAAQSEGGRPEQELSELSLKPEEVPENREKVKIVRGDCAAHGVRLILHSFPMPTVTCAWTHESTTCMCLHTADMYFMLKQLCVLPPWLPFAGDRCRHCGLFEAQGGG